MSDFSIELNQVSQIYTKLLPSEQPKDDCVYNSPLPSIACSSDPLQTVSPPAVKPLPPLKSTAKQDKWRSASATLLLILIALNIIVIGFLITVFTKLPSEANNATQAGNTTSNRQEANGQEAAVFQQHEEMADTNSTSRLLQNLTREMAMLTAIVQRSEATVNQTLDIQQRMSTTLPAMKTTADQTKEIVENVSKTVDNFIILFEPDSCQDIKEAYPASTSGYYTINGEEVYCGMDLCGTNKGWKRLAYLDMNDTTVDCPSGLQYYVSGSVRACGRPTSSGGSCASLKFPSNGISYSEVCGRVVGYQYATPDGLNTSPGTTIDSYYVDGVSITSGYPRTHVWTLIGTVRDVVSLCPCSSGYSGSLLSFMGNDYFCESGNAVSFNWDNTLFTNDPLWDGKECNNNEVNCCLASGLPWFHKTISTTSDYLELRVCGNEATTNENTPLSFYEIFVK